MNPEEKLHFVPNNRKTPSGGKTGMVMFKPKTLKLRKEEVLSHIRGERSAFETMVQRAQATGGVLNDTFVQGVLTRIAEYEQSAEQETSIDKLDDLIDDVKEQGQLRAYICPLAEIRDEGSLSIDRIEEWNVPEAVISRLRKSQGKKIENVNEDEASARSALLYIFKEYDSWSDYTDTYEDIMQKYTLILLIIVLMLPLVAVFSICVWPSPPFSTILSVLLAGTVGSCVSVMRKMPALDVKFSGELVNYPRRIQSRIGAGVIGSLIGCALLGWGLIPIAIHGKTFADVLDACTATQAVPCTSLNTLILLCVPILFGFSERALVSFEQQFLSGKS